jgi:hypothetical protein
MQYDIPTDIAQSDRLRAALQRQNQAAECDKKDQSPPPGCGRRQAAGIALQLHLLERAETSPFVKARLKEAIASLGEILTLN